MNSSSPPRTLLLVINGGIKKSNPRPDSCVVLGLI
jgi:hypothetical protein